MRKTSCFEDYTIKKFYTMRGGPAVAVADGFNESWIRFWNRKPWAQSSRWFLKYLTIVFFRDLIVSLLLGQVKLASTVTIFRLYFGFLDGLADKPTLATESSDPRRVNVRKRGDTILGLDSFAECTYISVTLTPWNFSLFASSKAVGHFRVPKNSHSQNDGG